MEKLLQKDAVCCSTLSIIIEQSSFSCKKNTKNSDNLWSRDW